MRAHRVRFVQLLGLAVAVSACAGSGAPAAAPTSPLATLVPAVPSEPGMTEPAGGGETPGGETPVGDMPGGEPLPAGTAAAVSVRGEAYTFAEAAATTCIVAPSLVSVIATSTDPRLTLTITWRAGEGTRHVSFGSPGGQLGVWQAGDEIPGASDVDFTVERRTAIFSGPMRHADETIDQATIQVSC